MSTGTLPETPLDAKGMRFAVVATRWNAEIVDALVGRTVGELNVCKAVIQSVDHCPGVFELAPLVARTARKGGVDGIIAIGCVIRGETDHYALLANETTRALGQLALELATNPQPIAVTFGVLACENEDQARRRVEKGREFARACVSQAIALRMVGD